MGDAEGGDTVMRNKVNETKDMNAQSIEPSDRDDVWGGDARRRNVHGGETSEMRGMERLVEKSLSK